MVLNEEGFLKKKLNYIDFAGSSSIHMVGGLCGLMAAIFLNNKIS